MSAEVVQVATGDHVQGEWTRCQCGIGPVENHVWHTTDEEGKPALLLVAECVRCRGWRACAVSGVGG